MRRGFEAGLVTSGSSGYCAVSVRVYFHLKTVLFAVVWSRLGSVKYIVLGSFYYIKIFV
jgi:hypothetical protein